VADSAARHRGTGWALVLSGVARPLGLVDAWPSGPWPLYSVVFGYLDNVFAAWALLRYPEPRLSRPVRWYLGVLAGWLIGLPAVLALVARPGWMVPKVNASTCHGELAVVPWPGPHAGVRIGGDRAEILQGAADVVAIA
jgi:hypothetical protein